MLSGSAFASEINYRAQNPSFGGNPINGAYLFNQATAQNGHQDTGVGRDFYRPDPIDQFKTSLTSRLLSEMSTQLANAMYGPDAQDSGSYTVGQLHIDFERRNGQLIVDVLDTATGNKTVIELPILQ